MDDGVVRLHDDEVPIDVDLVRRLIGRDLPDLSDEPIVRVVGSGTSNAMFRLGDRLSVRLPRHEASSTQVAREATSLPRLAPLLDVEVPVPVHVGGPGFGYPFPWLVARWVDGADDLAVASSPGIDELALADEVGRFVRSLRSAPVRGAPVAGKRGRSLAVHDEAVCAGVRVLAERGEVDHRRAIAVWEAALAAEPWGLPPVWVHGDLLPGNLVLRSGRLAGVIDWSAAGLGDPACEAMLAWGWSRAARRRFGDAVGLDDATWARGRGWALEQAVAFIPYYEDSLPLAVAVAAARHRLAAVIGDDLPPP
ncbi:MAG: aminoglycoside phosphotransferase family protein [Acidimicrobiales bacterium]|nr:aminoglycoside phosphotransferase family protein [Acidimicrobiales bacterium]